MLTLAWPSRSLARRPRSTCAASPPLAAPAPKFRQALRRLDREGGRVRIIDPPGVAAVLPALRRVSDDWLARKATGEKGFSLGFFDDAYLRRFPVAVVERDSEITAFANLWPGAQKVELSVDLMRFTHMPRSRRWKACSCT